MAQLDALLTTLDVTRAAAAGDRMYAFDQPWAVFARTMRLLTPQAYGGRIQHWLTDFYGWSAVPASDDRGDVLTPDGRHLEVKVTYLTVSNSTANFVQIRPHQDIDGYELFVIEEDFTVTRFCLTAAQMHAELASVGSFAHGTKAAVADNTTREFAVRLTMSSEQGARWQRAYGTPSGITPGSRLLLRTPAG